MKVIIKISAIVFLLLGLQANITYAQKRGSILRFENYGLYSESLNIDTIGYYSMEYKNQNQLKLSWKDSLEQIESKFEIRIVFNKDSFPTVYFGEDCFKTKGIEKSIYYISSKEYTVTKIEAISKQDDHADFSLYVLNDYGLLISESNLYDNHMRYLPSDINSAFRFSILCDEILRSEKFEKYRQSKK